MGTTFDGNYTDSGTLVMVDSTYNVSERDTPFVHELPHVTRQFRDEVQTVHISEEGLNNWLQGIQPGPSDDDRREVNARRVRQRLDPDYKEACDLEPPQHPTCVHGEASYDNEADDELTDDETNLNVHYHGGWNSVCLPMVLVEDDHDSPHQPVNQNYMLGFGWRGELITENTEELYDSKELHDNKEELYPSELTSTSSSDDADVGANGQSISASATIAEVVRGMTREQALEFLERLPPNQDRLADDVPNKDDKDSSDGDLPYSPTVHPGGSPGWALGPLTAHGDPRWHCESWGED